MKTLRFKSTLFIAVAVIGVTIFSTSCSKDNETVPQTEMISQDEFLKSNGAPPPGDDPIAQIAIDNGFNELVGALTYVDNQLDAGLVNLFMNGTDQYTVFAPTDDAFFALYDALPGVDEIEDLPATLVLDVLLYHVTEGRRASNSVVPKRGERTIQTLLGEAFTVDPQKMITAIGSTAYITTPDVTASNGIIHIIDGVLLHFEL
jgi:transforming growth factor-beta-induced protein